MLSILLLKGKLIKSVLTVKRCVENYLYVTLREILLILYCFLEHQYNSVTFIM